MSRRLVATAVVLLLGGLAVGPATSAGPAYVERLVKIPASSPDDSGDPVDLDASVAVPTRGTGPFPAIVFNHGFGGSRTSDGGTVERLTSAGYIVLRWSQRGFGTTGGEIDLMGQKERQDMYDAIDWLNDTRHVPEIWVDHIGQTGGSYGAQHGMALSTLNHPAVKAIAPLAGPLDLYRALAPHDVVKATIVDATWGLAVPTNKLSEEFHRIVAALNTGVGMSYAREQLRLRSEVDRVKRIHTPMFLVNGWNDSFFQADEWLDLYRQLDARGVPVWMYLGGIGHPPAEPDTGKAEALHIILDRLIPFFDHYVKGLDNGFEQSPRIEVANARWSHPAWDHTTMTVDGLPFGAPQRWRLCPGLPTGALQTTPCTTTVPAVLHNTYATAHPGGEYLARNFLEKYLGPLPEGRTATPVDTASFQSAPLAAPLQLTGTPAFGLDVIAASAATPDDGPGPAQSFQLDPLVWDVAPDGTRELVTRGAYSEDTSAPVGPHTATFDAFGFSYRFAAGHRILVELSTNDAPYLRPATNPFAVALTGGWLDLPGAERLQAPVAH